jgi:hypothetical protein
MRDGVSVDMHDNKDNKPRRSIEGGVPSGIAVLAFVAGSLAIGSGAVGAAARSATTADVIHLFARYGPSSFISASGQVLSMPSTFVAEDLIESSDTDHVGTHVHHANLATASDHDMCIFSSPKNASCYGQLAIGGSMIFPKFPLDMSPQSSAQIYGGTGSFKGATGSVHFVDVTPMRSTATATSPLTDHESRDVAVHPISYNH